MGDSAGGSSSGSAALLAAGEVDLAIGGDQGGSIRMPASFCGVYGMKATHGLVPYTGIMPIEVYVDHTGPMTNNVEDNALMLEVLAGEDGYDPRQYNVKTQKYTDALKGKKGIKGMKIAVVKEGFMQENAEKDVNTKVKAAIQKLKSMGAIVKEVSIPMHLLGPALWLPIGVEGLTQTMMYGDGYGVSRPDLYVTSLMDYHRNWRNRANEMSETTKLLTMLGTYIRKHHGSRYYGKAMNITRLLTAAYDKVLKDYDLLVMPTTALKATPLPAPDASREEYVQKALEMISNTAPFDITHHPAMAIPCGMSKGLPVSMMLVGKHFQESTIYQAAHAFEKGANWKKM
jgi:amidase